MYKNYDADFGGGNENAQDLSSLTIQADGQSSIDLPDSSYIRDADMMRDGMDLVLDGPHGHLVIEGYFAGETAPVLHADDGSALSPDLVNSFVKSAPEYAQSMSVTDESPVGAIQEVSGDASVTRTDGSTESVQIGTPIYQGDVIETGTDGAVNITFADDSSFAVSESARLAIDEFVFDPATEAGTQDFSVLKGMFVFTSGLIGRDDPDDVSIDTPVGSIGIRGTIIAGDVDAGEITVVEGAIVLRDFDGNEMTLASQFETGTFKPGQGIEHNGQRAANDVAEKFQSVSKVAPSLFSSINDAAAEAIDAEGVNEDVEVEEMLDEAPADDQPAPDADGSVDENADGQVDGSVEDGEVVGEGEAAEDGESGGEEIANQNPQNVDGTGEPAPDPVMHNMMADTKTLAGMDVSVGPNAGPGPAKSALGSQRVSTTTTNNNNTETQAIDGSLAASTDNTTDPSVIDGSGNAGPSGPIIVDMLSLTVDGSLFQADRGEAIFEGDATDNMFTNKEVGTGAGGADMYHMDVSARGFGGMDVFDIYSNPDGYLRVGELSGGEDHNDVLIQANDVNGFATSYVFIDSISGGSDLDHITVDALNNIESITIGSIHTGAGDDSIGLDVAHTGHLRAYTLDVGAGNDFITLDLSNAGADDVLLEIDEIKGGAGDDTFVFYFGSNTGNFDYNSTDNDGSALLDGGTGTDTIRIEGANASLDFSKIDNLSGIEKIDLSASGTQDVILTFDQLWDMAKGNLNDTIYIIGTASDTYAIDLQGNTATPPASTGSDPTFDEYTLVDTDSSSATLGQSITLYISDALVDNGNLPQPV